MGSRHPPPVPRRDGALSTVHERDAAKPHRGPLAAPGVADEVAAAAAHDAGGVDAALLGDFLGTLERAAASGRRLGRADLAHYRERGAEAARRGVALRALVDLYLSAAWRSWRHLPAVIGADADAQGVVRAGEAVLRAADDAVAAVTEGFQLARITVVRREVAGRREFVDDLLLGRTDADPVARAAGYGLDLAGPHAVAVLETERAIDDTSPVLAAVERALTGSKGDAGVLVASKEGAPVVVFAAPDRDAVREVTDRLGTLLGAPPAGGEAGVRLERQVEVGRWRLGVGRPRTGATGVRASYEEARSVLDLARHLDLEGPVLDGADLLVHQVLLRDREALTELMTSRLTPLLAARGGAGPLVDTLRAYFEAGGNSARTARSLHLSIRALTYRLDRIRALTGHDPADPAEWFTFQAAVLGARLLGWPASTGH